MLLLLLWQPLPELRHTKYGVVLDGVRLYAQDQTHLPALTWEKRSLRTTPISVIDG